MKRRSFFAAGAAAGFSGAMAAGSRKRSIFELTYIRMRRNPDFQQQRTGKFLETSVVPALKRAGAGKVGIYTTLIGPESPTIIVLVSYPSLAGLEAVHGKVAADAEFRKAVTAYNRLPGLGYQRIEKRLLRAFETEPDILASPPGSDHAKRIFEMRTYESDDSTTLARKIRMFNEGEISIFRRLGMSPVFFGETIVGPKMPNLTYMLAFNNLAAREKGWAAFGKDPAWRKLRSQPDLRDAEIVCNISNCILRPLPGSEIS